MQLAPENSSAAGSPFTTRRDAEWRSAFEAARTSWPPLSVTFQELADHLAQLGYQRELPAQLDSVYLCLACARGCRSACEVLDTRYFPALRAFLSRFDSRSDVIDDLLQQIRYRLLVGPAPRIGGYRGKGSLDGWLRKVANTIAVDCIRIRVGRERLLHRLSQDKACSDQICAAAPLAPDEQLHNERYARVVQHALTQSLQSLPRHSRQLLHYYYVGGLSIDQLGSIYACNRSTAARRLVRSVEQIRRSLRQELQRQLGPSFGDELENWMPVLYQSWGLEVSGWLVSQVPPATDSGTGQARCAASPLAT